MISSDPAENPESLELAFYSGYQRLKLDDNLDDNNIPCLTKCDERKEVGLYFCSVFIILLMAAGVTVSLSQRFLLSCLKIS